ncbi:hypothetical protein WJ69_34215 [Burkholderia ubonensis]|uniref:type III secretion system gatekeeper subunit SctW n=1 Tax=Burkholderia ubonensis TaxID=101571 RepID=UPI00075CAA8D|nr:type III secretion system gatekeeper subunit SctW [Burkholderia ubonensis]KVN98513.1 hypothetical protein WJ69_34215 [Burkholderia ubonensis]
MSRIGAVGIVPAVPPAVTRHDDGNAAGAASSPHDVLMQTSVSEQGGNIQAQITDAQEDMSEVMAQFARRLGRRGSARRSDDAERILEPEAEEKLDELGRLIEFSQPNAQQLLGDARRRFGDVSDLMLALRELRRRRRLEGEPVDIVDDAIEELARAADPKLMKAGINVALKAKVFGKRMRLEPARLRQLYRQFLLFEGTYLMIYESWVEEYGLKRRRRILDFMQAALTYDMHSLDPSCTGAEEFGPLLSLLGRARTLNSADEQFLDRLVQSKLRVSAELTEALGITILLSALRSSANVAVMLEQLLAPELTALAPKEQSRIVQSVLRAAIALPLTVFDAAEDRYRLIDAIKAMADAPFEAERRARGVRGR